jgi:hypothetical protein
LEQAHRLVFGYGYIPWEFKDGVRNWLFPWFLSLFVHLGSFMGPGSWGYSSLVYALLCSLSLIPVYYIYKTLLPLYGKKIAFASSFIFATYSYLVYMAPKAFNEVVAAHIFFIAFMLFEKTESRQYKSLFLAGLFAGLVVVLRFHYAPAVGVLILWFVWKKRIAFLPTVLGALLMLMMAGYLDYVSWGSPFQSFWLYVKRNIIEGIANLGGVEPWYYYLKQFLQTFHFTLPFLIFFGAVGVRIRPLLFFIFLSVLIPHSFVSHKEFRFVYLASLSFIMMASLGFADLLHSFRNLQSHFRASLSLATLCLLLLFAHHRNLYLGWGGVLQSFQSLSTDEKLCGLAIRDFNWTFSGGYYFLHRQVHIMEWEENKMHFKTFNSIIGKPENFDEKKYAAYKKKQCFQDYCVYKREGACT